MAKKWRLEGVHATLVNGATGERFALVDARQSPRAPIHFRMA